MPDVVVWAKANVDFENGESKIFERGDKLPDKGLSEFTRSSLRIIGATKAEEDSPKVSAVELLPPMPELSPVVPQPGDTGPVQSTVDPEVTAVTPPSAEDTKAAWVEYVTNKDVHGDKALTKSQADNANKEKLVKDFGPKNS